MRQEDFDRLVGRQEAFAASHPRLYRTRVGLLGIAGYACVFGFFAVVAAALGALAVVAAGGWSRHVAIAAGIPPLLLGGVVVRWLWVRRPAPKGISLRRDEARHLIDAVETIRRAVRAPRIHEILLTGDFGASIVRRPRLGIFGWRRNYLTVGLPMMFALSPAQLEAALAHEIAHLSGAGGAFGAWVSRIRRTWYRLMEAPAPRERWGGFFFNRFLRWYAPFFGAYSFPLARANEYAADRCSADYAGANAAAEALVAVNVKWAFLDETYWPAVLRKADDNPDPPFPFREMEPALASSLGAGYGNAFVSRVMSRKAGSDDLHPSLSDRLAAIGKEPRLPEHPAETAARRFLPGSFEGLAARLDEAWRKEAAGDWRERHVRAREAQKCLGELETLAAAGALPPGESMRRAALVEEVRGGAAALPLYREIAAADEHCAEAHHAAGRILLSAGDDRGISLLEKAMELDAGCIIDACDRIHGYLMSRGREKDALVYYDRGERRAELLERAKSERDSVSPGDTFLPHELAREDLDAVTSQLARYPELRRAYLVRKDVKLFPQFPQYVLGAAIRFPWYEYMSQRRLNDLHLKIAGELEFPFPAIVVNLSVEGAGAFRKKMKKVPGAEIYGKGSRR